MTDCTMFQNIIFKHFFFGGGWQRCSNMSTDKQSKCMGLATLLHVSTSNFFKVNSKNVLNYFFVDCCVMLLGEFPQTTAGHTLRNYSNVWWAKLLSLQRSCASFASIVHFAFEAVSFFDVVTTFFLAQTSFFVVQCKLQ